MTKEEIQLLLIDLCARLPYGVIVKILDKDILSEEGNERGILDGKEIMSDNNFVIKCDKYGWILSYDEFKPYLRPMSSMTEEEKDEYLDIKKGECDGCVLTGKGDPNTEFMLIDFYNKHHLDYRGLIEKGLALEAPEDMYKTE